MSAAADALAARLLEAHVAHVLAAVRGDGLDTTIERLLDEVLTLATELTLEETVGRDVIKATAHTYAIDFELPAAIPEIVGDIARAIYAHEAQAETTVGQLVSGRTFAQFLDKVLELKELRAFLVHELVTQPAYAEFATELVVVGLRGVLARRAERAPTTKATGPLATLLEAARASEARERLDEALDTALHAFVRENLGWVLARSERLLLANLDDPRLRELGLRLWDELATRRLSTALATVTDRDIEELFVLGYEAYKQLRKTAYYRAMIDAGVDGVFDTYGTSTLATLLDELGVDRAVMRREARRFGPLLVEALDARGLLEDLTRKALASFYRSDTVASVLDEALGAAR